jgi:hypothetical protein
MLPGQHQRVDCLNTQACNVEVILHHALPDMFYPHKSLQVIVLVPNSVLRECGLPYHLNSLKQRIYSWNVCLFPWGHDSR